MKPLPASFLGRERELGMLHALLGSDRLVTLHGSAGTGKTRLAIRYAELHTGIGFADLTAAQDIEGVCAAVARALDVPLRAQTDVEAILAQLAQALDSGPPVLILDNCEQCVEAVARAASHWLEHAPHTRFIATSREVLRVVGERVQELGPLGLPGGMEDAAASEAVRLFVDRAQRARPGWVLAPAETPNVIEIVRHLDGLPLAIELAAARMSMMGTADIVRRLPRRFDLLSSTTRGTSERQRTLRGAIDWSWDLSSPWERAALVQCAVFSGSFSVDAAERVIDLSAYPDAPAPLEAVRALRDKSYLRPYEPPELAGEVWLVMYESIREFALEKLQSEREAAALRHAAYHAEAAAELADAVWGHQGAAALRRLGAMRDNLLAAHGLALANGEHVVAAQIAMALERVALDRGPHTTYAALYDRTIEAVDGRVPDAMLGRLLVTRSFQRMLRVDRPAARADADRAASIARAEGDRVLEVRALQVIGQVAVPQGDEETIRMAMDRLVEIAATATDGHLEGLARMVRGLLFVVRGERLEDARTELDRSLVCFREVGDAHRTATVLNVMGVLLTELGRLDEARTVLQQAIEVCMETNDRFREACCLAYLGGVCIQADHLDEARDFAEAAVKAFASLGERWQQALARGNLGAALALRGDIEGAAKALDRAEAELVAVGDQIYVVAVRVHRGQLDLARARTCDAAGDVVGTARHRAAAEARLVGADGTLADDVRFAARMLVRELSRAPAALGEVPAPEALVVAADGRWFRAPHGTRVDFGNRRTLSSLLAALVESRASAPGKAVSHETLLERGWPGERVLHEAATNRVRVAMTTLRQLGLAGVLKSAHEGYWLDRDVPIVVGN